MQTSNTEEMVTISRVEYERLQQENVQMEATRVRLEAERIKLEAEHARLEAKLATLEQEQAQVITSLTLQNEWLLEQLKLSKKKLFGRSSEQAEQIRSFSGRRCSTTSAGVPSGTTSSTLPDCRFRS